MGPGSGWVVVIVVEVVSVILGGEVVVLVCDESRTPVQAHATTSNRLRMGFMLESHCDTYRWLSPNLKIVFGPLNGVRVALVIAAALAGLTALVAGYAAAGIVLLAGVALHGAGWLYLYSHRYPDSTDPRA